MKLTQAGKNAPYFPSTLFEVKATKRGRSSGETEGSSGETEGSSGEREGSNGETEGSSGETEGSSGETEGSSGETEGSNGESSVLGSTLCQACKRKRAAKENEGIETNLLV